MALGKRSSCGYLFLIVSFFNKCCSDPPSAVTLHVNTTHSCESDTECSADVTIGSRYRFACNASGSSPASNITWLINTKARSGMGQTEISPDWSQSRQGETNEDWETSSRIDLQILPEHHQGSIACRATFPDGGTVFREITVKLIADDKHEVLLLAILIPTAVAVFIVGVVATVGKLRSNIKGERARGYRISTQEVILSRVSPYEIEGQETEFKCTLRTDQCQSIPQYFFWLINGSHLSDGPELRRSCESRLKKKLYRDQTGSTLMCVSQPASKNASLTLNVMYPPSAMTLQVNTTHSCESNTECSADVTIGSRYRFICNASGSNPASNITWLINTNACSGMGQTEIPPDWSQSRQDETNEDWETSSQIQLQILPEHRQESITCRATFPDGVFRERVMELIVNDKLDELQLLAIGIPAAVTVFVIVVIATFCTLRSNAKRKRAQEVTEVMEEGTMKKCNFPRSKITLFDVIGSGNFGQVFRATADGILQEGVETEVAVKVLKESADEAAACDFKKEIAIHKTLKRHPNVVSMFGCCTDSEPFVIILELLPGGSLQGYLRNKKKAWTEEAVEGAKPVPPSELLAFASQIASGMEYLSSVGHIHFFFLQCIHRDLAVRNVLLDKDMVCKLSDFGLARDVSETQHYEMTSMGMIPVRWLAIESLLDDVYTTMSDVWSFGVLLWEIVTLGAHPYRGMHARDVIDSIERGFRLPNPTHCSEQLYEVMNETWQETPSERPTFRELRETLEGMIPDAPIYLDMANFVADHYVGENS
ncbi:tyrosine-protein kinase transmembrane receptor Ror-like [Patiria miniata]|uniref:receptor protein-tyrosine kinase n=1 Tax=Patiria miniata TaxID=46514 RepID=A0A914A016_PATMI|nr:tyrosine-protein kinase transmembrane receptor Ror-like [Patiria miniata]